MMQALSIAPWLIIGIVAGTAYFAAIWWSARQFADNGRLPVTIGLVVLRLAGLGGLLVLASLRGAGPLLAMALGVMIARFAVMRRLRGVVP